jgi:hypothetical protein
MSFSLAAHFGFLFYGATPTYASNTFAFASQEENPNCAILLKPLE